MVGHQASLTISVKVLDFCNNFVISQLIYFILTHNVALDKTFTLICHIVTFKSEAALLFEMLNLL